MIDPGHTNRQDQATDVLRVVRAQYVNGQRVDLIAVADQLGFGREAIQRRFGSREALLSEAIFQEFELLMARKRAQAQGIGAWWLLEVLDGVNQALSRSVALRWLLEHEQRSGLRLLTSSGGHVQPRVVASIQRLIYDQVAVGAYLPTASPDGLAFALVRVMEAFLYDDADAQIRGDHEPMREIQAALLGVQP
ncbi:MAG TPA: QsdR family transcriptional regulator [Solirubrobacteraceae bacterium]